MKAEKIQQERISRTLQQMQGGGGIAQFVDNRANQPLQMIAESNEEDLTQLKSIGSDGAVQLVESDEDEDSLQLKGDTAIQRKPNNTGLPDNLKSGIENLSGYSMDDVRVNYNSPKPAQLHALAYTQGTDIHVAPGQEKHLAHETWHVVQQKQGRVQPTVQMKGVNVNDDEGLEHEADVMGGEVLQTIVNSNHSLSINMAHNNNVRQCKLENKEEGMSKFRINKALYLVKNNSYGKKIFDKLEASKNVTNIIHDSVDNASLEEIKVNTKNRVDLDVKLFHEMTHVAHMIVKDEIYYKDYIGSQNVDPFNLDSIYQDIINLHFLLYRQGTKSPSFKEQESDFDGNNKRIGHSFQDYFHNQEEELVVQEWEKSYSDEENTTRERNLYIRKHYIDTQDANVANGFHTGILSSSAIEDYEKIYGNKVTAFNRLNSYDDFIKLLNDWKTWLNVNATDKIIDNTATGWKKDNYKKEKNAILKAINMKITECESMNKLKAK